MRLLKIGTSSVRGVVSEPFTPELAVNFACAFGTYCDAGTVVIARDTRRSSTMLRAAVLSSLLSTGCRVLDLGVCPTPMLSFAIRELGAAGGISITGSHNDARWNAFKFLGADGALLNAVKTEELLDIYHAAEFSHVPWDQLQGWAPAPDLLDRYVAHLLAPLDVERIRQAKFRVAVDFCNGAAAPVVTRLLDELGCTLIPLNEEPSSDFAHAPAPNPTNMRQLAALMRHLEADLGAACNIDGDRLGLVTADGIPLSEEHTFPLVADHLLAQRHGPIVTNLSTSRMIDEVARTYGQPVIRTLIGEGPVVDRALAESAVIAGEGSGGVAVPFTTITFDAFLTLGVLLEAMAVTGESLQALADRLPQYFIRKGTLACPPNLVYHLMEGFRQRFLDHVTDRTDGLRIEWEDAWLHIRASNTEPLLRVIVESSDAARAETLYTSIMGDAHRMAFGKATAG